MTYLTHNNKIYNFFSMKTHLIKVLGLGPPTTNLRIRSSKSRSATIELFLSSSRAPSQNLSRNGSHLVIQTACQSSSKNEESLQHPVLPLFKSLAFSSFFFFFFNSFNPSATIGYGPKAQWIYSLFLLKPNSSKAQINSFYLFILFFIFTCFFFHFQFIFIF